MSEQESSAAKTSGYEKLEAILGQAGDLLPPGDGVGSPRGFLVQAGRQSSGGKGVRRHANDRAWLEQPITEIQRDVGTAFALGQAMKKVQEAERMPVDQALEELKGAIVYLAAWCAVTEEIWDPQGDHGVPDPGKMAEHPHFQDTLRQIHQTLFCASMEQELAAGHRAIAAVAQLATRITELAEGPE